MPFLYREIVDPRFFELNHAELFLLLSISFLSCELREMFYYALTESGNFRSLVLKKYKNSKSVQELASNLGMSVGSLNGKFIQNFGVPPGKWLIQQKSKEIFVRMHSPNLKIKDIINEFDFSSPSQFTRFCKTQFGKTPKQLLRGIQMQLTDENNKYD